MPALVAFGRKWDIGSDDLAVPAGLEAFVAGAWLANYLPAYWHVRVALLDGAHGGALWLLCGAGGVALLTTNTLLMFCIIHNSFKGTVINAWPRRHASTMMAAKVGLQVAVVSLAVGGVALPYFRDPAAVLSPGALAVLQHSLQWLWGPVVVGLLTSWHIFSLQVDQRAIPAPRRKDLERVESVTEAMKTSWHNRFKSVGKLLGLQGHPALGSLAGFFTDYFKNEAGLVPTDALAALYLLHHRQTRSLQEMEHADHCRSDPSPRPQPWMNCAVAAHYMKYAAGIYGWPMYIWSSPLALWGLVRVLASSRYIPRRLPKHIVNDNPLMANTTVIKLVTGLVDQDLLLINYHNKLFQVPYFVALDHERKSIVVAVRGTLSIEDILTDLVAFQSEPIGDLPDLPEAYAHLGMLEAAKYVRTQLLGLDSQGQKVEDGLLEQAYRKLERDLGIDENESKEYPVVLVGHSLGAGVVSILAVLMKHDQPYGQRLKCFAFSPPGGLLDLKTAKYAESFVCSVVLGDDIVPRLGLRSAYDLKVKILENVKDLDKAKHELFGGWFLGMLWRLLGVKKPPVSTCHLDSEAADPPSWTDNPEAERAVRNLQGAIQCCIDDSKRKRDEQGNMFPAGCVMYIQETRDSKCPYRDWMVCGDSYRFGEILFTDNCVRHHTPWCVLHSLREMVKQRV